MTPRKDCRRDGRRDRAVLRRNSTIGASGPDSRPCSSSETRQIRATPRASETSPRTACPAAAYARAGAGRPLSFGHRRSSWKPPTPLSATIQPRRIAACREFQRRSSLAIRRRHWFHSASCGPQSGQALGSAWKRRLAGSRTRPGSLAHDESLHRGSRPVVGELLDDAEAGATLGAVDERIAVSPVAAVLRVRPGSFTRGEVRPRIWADPPPARRARAERRSYFPTKLQSPETRFPRRPPEGGPRLGSTVPPGIRPGASASPSTSMGTPSAEFSHPASEPQAASPGGARRRKPTPCTDAAYTHLQSPREAGRSVEEGLSTKTMRVRPPPRCSPVGCSCACGWSTLSEAVAVRRAPSSPGCRKPPRNARRSARATCG